MKKALTNQKRMSTIMAMGLAALITLFAASSSFGVTSNEDLSEDDGALRKEILDRAVADVMNDNLDFNIETDDSSLIKVYDNDNQLVDVISLTADGRIENKKDEILLNKADYLSTYGKTSIYRISK